MYGLWCLDGSSSLLKYVNSEHLEPRTQLPRTLPPAPSSRLFAYAKLTEDMVKNIIRRRHTEDVAERIKCTAKIQRDEL